MRADALNWHNYGSYTEMNYLSLTVCSTDEEKSKQSIVNKNLLQNYSVDVDEICYKEIDISEYTITEQKYAEY